MMGVCTCICTHMLNLITNHKKKPKEAEKPVHSMNA